MSMELGQPGARIAWGTAPATGPAAGAAGAPRSASDSGLTNLLSLIDGRIAAVTLASAPSRPSRAGRARSGHLSPSTTCRAGGVTPHRGRESTRNR